MSIENGTPGQSEVIQMIDFNHGENGVTLIARDKVGRNPVFHFAHSSAPRIEADTSPQVPSVVQTLSTLRQLSKKSGVNDNTNTLHPKP